MNALEIEREGVNFWLFSDWPEAPVDFCIKLPEVERVTFAQIENAMAWALANRGVLEEILFNSAFAPDEERLTEIASGYAPRDRVIAQLAQGIVNKHRRNVAFDQAREKLIQKKTGGFVYLAHVETGHFKIGLSVGPVERIKVFDTKMPVKVSLIHTIRADDMHAAEKLLHEMFADKRHEGEWFTLDSGDTDYICSLSAYENEQFL